MITIEERVNLGSTAGVKEFVAEVAASRITGELKSGPYIVDAESLMGIFSLDLSKPLTFVMHGEQADIDDLVNSIRPYIA